MWILRSLVVRCALAALLLVGCLAGWAQAADAADASRAPLIVILDASGSMWGQVDGENKIVIARRALADLVDALPAASQLGLVAYGHRRKGDCDDIETVVPLGVLDAAALKAKVDALQPTGKTPITASVERALEIVEAGGAAATIILLSDGLETCGGDPCRAVQLAREAGTELVLHVVGFDVANEDLTQLQCMAQAGGGLYLAADDAAGLSSALDQAVAMPVDVPAGRLLLHATADDARIDAAIFVTHPDGRQAGGGRTYTGPNTNPRAIPLADGTYDVRVQAVGLKGAYERTFSIEITGGGTVEKTVDYSTGELTIGVTRNGALSDATYRVYTADGEDRTQAASGRLYDSDARNPARVKLTAGRYDVSVKLIDVENKPTITFDTVEIARDAPQHVQHDYVSGTLQVGAVRAGERVDAVVSVRHLDENRSVAQSRTYTGEKTNPRTFALLPGRYAVAVKTVGKGSETRTVEVEIAAGETVAREVDFDG